jgi:hypothetical protein
MFRALLAHPQQVLHKRHLAYYVRTRIMSVGCATIAVKPQSWYSNVPSAVCATPSKDEQVILETCRGS